MHAVRRSLNLKYFGNVLRHQIGPLGRLDLRKTFYTYSPEPGQPLNREPTFCSVDEAVKCVKSGKKKSYMPSLSHRSHVVLLALAVMQFIENGVKGALYLSSFVSFFMSTLSQTH